MYILNYEPKIKNIYFLPFVILTTFMKIIRGFCFEMYKPEVQLNSGFTPLWTIVVRREIYSVLSQVYFTQNMFLVTTTYLRRAFTHVCIQIIELRYECASLKIFSYITIGYGLYVNVALIFLSPLDPVYSISKESLRHIVNKNINMLKRVFLGGC